VNLAASFQSPAADAENAGAVANLRLFAKQLDDLLHVAPALAALRAGLDGKSDDDPQVRAAAIGPALTEFHAQVARLEAKDDREARSVIAVARDGASKIKSDAQAEAEQLLAGARAESAALQTAIETDRAEHAQVSAALASTQAQFAAVKTEYSSLVAALDHRRSRVREAIDVVGGEYEKLNGTLAAKRDELDALTCAYETVASLIATGKSAIGAGV
jgi:chromosome segregation ATPase